MHRYLSFNVGSEQYHEQHCHFQATAWPPLAVLLPSVRQVIPSKEFTVHICCSSCRLENIGVRLRPICVISRTALLNEIFYIRYLCNPLVSPHALRTRVRLGFRLLSSVA